jgi:hypothetical protein
MPSVIELLKELPQAKEDAANPATDANYIRKSSVLVSDALQKGSDVMQLANGDIVITEVKTVTYKYQWDESKGKFERATTGSRVRRKKREGTKKAKVA